MTKHHEDSFGMAATARFDVPSKLKVCIVGASGKPGKYMVQHCLDRGYEVVAVCREGSVAKLDAFKGRITFSDKGQNLRGARGWPHAPGACAPERVSVAATVTCLQGTERRAADSSGRAR